MRKLLLALQVYPGDFQQGLELTELICDLEQQRRMDVDFALFRRRDITDDQWKEWMAIACEKFNTRIIRCNRFGTGWPFGSNDVWADCMLQVADLVNSGKEKWDGVLTFEPDCVPLRVDWIDVLKNEWEKAREEGYQVIGHLHGEGDGAHINGNAIFSATMIRDHPQTASSGTSWDMQHRQLFMEIGRDTNAIFQIYADKNLHTPDQLGKIRKNGEIPALLHGMKHPGNIHSARTLLTLDEVTTETKAE